MDLKKNRIEEKVVAENMVVKKKSELLIIKNHRVLAKIHIKEA